MDLHPEWRNLMRDFTPETGGVPTDKYELSFDCPDCGQGARISVKIGPVEDRPNRIWGATPLPPDGANWPDNLTLSSSINFTTAGHGPKRPPCTFHKSIVNGGIV